MIAKPELWTNATFLCWKEIKYIKVLLAHMYLEHPDGDNGQCEEEGVEQKGETAEKKESKSNLDIFKI